MWDCQFDPDDFDWEGDEVTDAPVPSVYNYEEEEDISVEAARGINQLMEYLRR